MALKARLQSLIRDTGPIPLTVYMEMCLHDPTHGYYATRSAIGGDFTTAPEISQLFGECLAIWVALTWQNMGYPEPVQLVECGPGRGVLMMDMLRTLKQISPKFIDAVEVVLIEASPDLRARQLTKLADYSVTHCPDLISLPDRPTLLIGNEFLDCLPARKYAKLAGKWVELCVGIAQNGAFCLVPSPLPMADFPEGVEAIEIQPALDGLVTQLAARTHPLHALWVDYGPADSRVQDSFRAYSGGKVVDPFAHQGLIDLTVDVDFGHLRTLASQSGFKTKLQTQAAFLLGLGLEEGFARLTKNCDPQTKSDLYESARRLTHPDEMGAAFKAMEMWRY